MDTIQGCSTNIGSYFPLGSVTSNQDPCKAHENYNPALNEAIYIHNLSQYIVRYGISNNYTYITDTARNGKIPCNNSTAEYGRNPCGELCNVKGCQFGELPSTNTNITGIGNLIDAFVWIHEPQLSDGISNSSSPDYVVDLQCNNSESLSGAPEYNYWFDEYFVMLANTTADNKKATD